MTKTTLMEFPCQFPIKIIGINSSSFIEDVKAIALKHFPDFKSDDLTQKLSTGSSYLAFTVTVLATSQKMLDAFYMEISKNPGVKMVL